MKTDITPNEETRLRRTLWFMESTAPSTNGELDLPVVDHRSLGKKKSVLAFVAGLGLVLVALLPVLFLGRDAPTNLSSPSGDSDAPVPSTRVDDGLENPTLIEVTERDGLTLMLRGDPSNPCLEVLSENGMAGGCGVDFDAPLHLGVGSIGDASFVDGWAPEDAVRVKVTLADGTEIEAAELAAVDSYQVRFFLELLPASGGTAPELPITAAAFDQTGNILAEYTLEYTVPAVASVPESCPVTVPGDNSFTPASKAPEGPPEVYDVVWYGTPQLWTMVNPDGQVWRDLPVEADGSLTERTFWWSENYSRDDPGEITVTAEHLNGSAPTIEVSEPAGRGFNPFMLVSTHESVTVIGIELPEPGCFELTAEYKGAMLSYVVWVSDD